MPGHPFVSICIPAYKRVAYLSKLLESISIQSFRDFEVVITDDSPGDEVKLLIEKYMNSFTIGYEKNQPVLGTPSNWNQSISRAKGEWIKLMHDDDWFATSQSLQYFVNATGQNKKFIFSAYENVFTDKEKSRKIIFPKRHLSKIISNPMLLFPKNIIGPPSVTMLHHSIAFGYDVNMKWRVDIDFYIRVLQVEKDCYYINEPLIKVGVSELQVTNSCLNVPAVELPEGLLILEKFGTGPLRNIWIYDTWWRLFRNMNVRDVETLSNYTPGKKWPGVIHKILHHQSMVNENWLRVGIISKFCMLISYLVNRSILMTAPSNN